MLLRPRVLLVVLSAAHPSLAFQAQPLADNKKARNLGFVSFDLDDTLFPTDQVVKDANHVMIEELCKAGYATSVQDFLDTTRCVRKTLDDTPITYSDLRKRAIEKEIQRLNGGEKPDSQVVDQMFRVWLEERHRAAERYLFPDSISMLGKLRTAYPDVCIGAITNGRGNPLDMTNTLSHLFDFCVSGEDEGVFPERKPHPGIYTKALDQYRLLRPNHEPDTHMWCHVGDCLAHDIGASAACGALAVWLSPEDGEDDDGAAATSEIAAQIATGGATPFWSTATEKDRNRRAQLAQEARQKVSARISSLSQLPDVIETLLTAVVGSPVPM